MKIQLLTMLAMQDEMNTKVHPQWRQQEFQWYRAIWIECAELMDHYGWKWWKKQTPDIDQVTLELIDIWHFGLSQLLQNEVSNDILAQALEQALLQAPVHSRDHFLGLVEDFSADCLQHKSFNAGLFAQLINAMDISFNQLYRSYVGKNVLNFFRQDHGYKEGHYLKEWQGKEDNQHLVEVLDALDPQSVDFQQQLYSALSARYPKP
jgi:dimeric dUTPase (all-alpha-NTP-PPase superfamily)